MTSGNPGKPPISPRTLSMIFNSGDFSKLLESTDNMAAQMAAARGPANAYESTDSTAAIFRSTDFLKSLDAYKESMSRAGEAAGNDPAAFFRSADFLKSLDTLPKERKENVFRSIDFLQSLDFASTDGQKLGRDIFSSTEGKKVKDAFASVDVGKKQLKDIFSSRDWAREYKPDTNGINKSLFESQDSVSSVSSIKSVSKMGKPLPPKKARQLDYFTTSQDWMGAYQGAHVDVKYNDRVFKSNESLASRRLDPPAAVATSLPPPLPASLSIPRSAAIPAPALKASSANKWMKMYQAGLNSSVPAVPAVPKVPPVAGLSPLATAAAAAPPPTPMVGVATAPSPTPDGKKPKKKRVYKSRKVIPEVKQFVQFTDDDVLLGRGGLSNKHPGNKRYRQEIENAKAVYRSASKDEKTEWANLLVEYVKKYGGRFLEKDKETGQWYIVPDVVARRKAGQALREDNTAESRKEKRDRYKKAHGKL